MKTNPEAKEEVEVNALPGDYPWVNFGLRPPMMKQIQIIKPTLIHGMRLNVGDIIQATEQDSITLITYGKATPYPPPQAKEESPEELAERRKKALSEGTYKVEITKRCMVKGFACEPGEVVAVCEDDAMCLTMCGRGKIISMPGEEDILEKVKRVIEEKLRDIPEKL